jgi:hypothetical protein
MTHISTHKTKKALKEAVKEDPTQVFLNDPSIFPGAISGSVAHIMSQRDSITVTNHPKRSWFAQIKNTKNGIRVS